jgi:hypothetical protein
MNKFKKATKRIMAVGASALMVSSAVFGASLSSYPTNFVEDNTFDAKIVVGDAAQAIDATAAQTIIDDLSNEFGGDVPKVTITYKSEADGTSVDVADSNDKLNFGEKLNEAVETFDDGDFSSLLDSGIVEDDDYEDEEYEYDQEIELGNVSISFNLENDLDEETNVPEAYLNLVDESLYTLVVDFEDDLNIADTDSDEDSGLVNSESIEMFGKTFTFDPNNEVGDDITLFASSNIVTVKQGETVSVESEGESFSVEVTGANSDDSTAILSVNGITKQVESGDNTKIAGLDVYVDEVFISTVGGDSAAVKLFLGSDEVVIPKGAFDGGWETIEVDGESIDGYEVIATGNESVLEKLQFKFTPDELDDEVKYLRAGDSIEDPLFGTLTVEFEGSSEEFDAGNEVSLERNGDDAELTFINRDGDEISFVPYQSSGAAIAKGEDLFGLSGNYTDVPEDVYLIINEGDDADDFVTKVYEVTNIDDGEGEVDFKELGSGNTITVDLGDEIGDSDLTVSAIASDSFNVTNGGAAPVETVLYTDGDVRIDLSVIGAGKANVTFTEDMDSNIDESSDVDAATVGVVLEYDSDDDVKIGTLTIVNSSDDTIGSTANDDDDDVEYGLTPMGSYIKLEKDNNGEYFKMYTPEEELSYTVNFIAGTVGTTQTTTVSEEDVETTKQELIDDGYVIVDVSEPVTSDVTFDVSGVVKDSDVSEDEADMIVVGGPAVNSVARRLLGIETYTPEAAGVVAGEGLIQYFEDSNSVLVYGYTGEDTKAAVDKLNDGGLSGEVYPVSNE